MPKGLPAAAKEHLTKCQAAAIAAVDAYNRPGKRFRTAQYIILIVVAWTACLHAWAYAKRRRPWYRRKTPGGAVRYVKVDGDPKHWELSECLKQYYGTRNPPERKNLEFLIGLRNKIEHRHLPALDATLYGECQAALLNLEDMLTQEFGPKYALAEQLAVSLQFSRALPEEKGKAIKRMVKGAAHSVREYIEQFRGGLPADTLSSMKYSFSVFLVPRIANRASAADAAVQFVKLNETNPQELARLDKLNVLIKDKHVPISNLGLFKPSDVVAEVNKRLQDPISMHVHTRAWQHYAVRPAGGDPHPEQTTSAYCVYDEVHGDYVYTQALS